MSDCNSFPCREYFPRMDRLSWLVILIAVCCICPLALALQECIGINFFDVPKSNLQYYTCWDGGKSYVYLGSPATFVRCDGAVPVDMSVGTGSLVFETTMPMWGWWNVEFKLDWGHSVNFLRYGENPLLYLRLKWDEIAADADMLIELIDDQQIWTLYRTYTGQGDIYTNQSASVVLSDYVSPSSDWQDVYIPMSDFLADNPLLDLTRISILKFHGLGPYSETNKLYIEKIKIVPSIGCEYSDIVKVNQLGYLPDERKLAIVSYEVGTVLSPPSIFQVIDISTDEVVYEGPLQLEQACSSEWDQSGDVVYHANFTSVVTPGQYVIYLPEMGQVSVVFEIRDSVFNQPFRDALRFFYYARSGYEIAEPYAEGHTRPAIYADNNQCSYDYDDNDPQKMYDYDPLDIGIETRDVLGGWFDAGDLHIDTHNNLGSLWFLLELLEQNMDKLGPNVLNLPESDGVTNDLVLLMKYELDWFKKMQNPDGSVHFMVIAPSYDQRHQYVSDVSTGAACVLAAVFAKAYPLFVDIPGFETYAQDLLDRAQLAWSWLQSHPDTYDPKGPDGNTWSYGISNDEPYRMFSAIELYIATGDVNYRDYFEDAFIAEGGNALTAFVNNQSWGGILGLIYSPRLNMGYMDYVETTRPVNESIRAELQQRFLDQADFIIDKVECTNYNIPMVAPNHLFWGSSGMLCANAYVLLRAYEWTGEQIYRNAARDALEWIGGRNPVSRVFITGYGDYLHGTDLYSFYWFDHLNPVPGYLCGNINCLGAGTGIWLDYYIQYPWKYYLNIQNASLLEPCLPWQAQMCYLLGYFATDLKKIGDVNFDGLVDMSDLSAFAQAWLSTHADTNWNRNCDISSPADDMIDFSDFAVLSNHWLLP